MSSASKYILYSALCIGCIGTLYFLSLAVQLPFIVTGIFSLILMVLVYKWLPAAMEESGKIFWAGYLMLFLGLYFMLNNANALAPRHGDWDAWSIWNYHAGYLGDVHNWKNMLYGALGHPDYPLCLPAAIAFFRRIFGGNHSLEISFGVNAWIMLCIPVLIFTEQYKKNILVAAAAFLFIATDSFFVARGVSQYADTLLAFFFLAALICINYASESRKYITLAAAMAGLCLWTKNEGIVLAGLFATCYAPLLFSRRNIVASLAGVALPLLAYLVFKFHYAPANDMVSGQNKNTLSSLLVWDRYVLIWQSFRANLNKNFLYVEIGFYLYLLACLMQKKWPGRQMLLLLACLAAYFMVYVVTPRDLQWHLNTSQDRLMHQLMPAMVYVIASKLSEINFSFPQKQAT